MGLQGGVWTGRKPRRPARGSWCRSFGVPAARGQGWPSTSSTGSVRRRPGMNRAGIRLLRSAARRRHVRDPARARCHRVAAPHAGRRCDPESEWHRSPLLSDPLDVPCSLPGSARRVRTIAPRPPPSTAAWSACPANAPSAGLHPRFQGQEPPRDPGRFSSTPTPTNWGISAPATTSPADAARTQLSMATSATSLPTCQQLPASFVLHQLATRTTQPES